jgi:hypothetical protein
VNNRLEGNLKMSIKSAKKRKMMTMKNEEKRLEVVSAFFGFCKVSRGCPKHLDAQRLSPQTVSRRL